MTSIFLFHDKNTSINDKSIISEKVYFCNVNFTRHPRRQIHQSLPKNRLNLSLIYDAEHSVILTELQSALRLSTPSHSPTFPHIDGASNYRHSVGTCLRHVSVATTKLSRIGNMPKACPYVWAKSFFGTHSGEDERRWGHKKALGLGSQGPGYDSD